MNTRMFNKLFLILLNVWIVNGCSRSRSSKPRDNVPPGLVCPNDIRQPADPVQVNAWITWEEPTASDNLDGKNVRVYPCGRGPNERYSGTNYITYRARDRAGNVNSCTFKVEVYVVYCDPPPSIDDGYYHFYPSNDFRYGGTATYGCYKGYERVGTQVLRCRLDETWSSAAPRCQKLTCPRIRQTIPHGTVSCTDQNRYQSQCIYKCESGYRIGQGQSRVRVCGHRRFWLGQEPSCVDVEPPVIHNCPMSKIVYTNEGKDTSTVTWRPPYATDNSGEKPSVTLDEGVINGPYPVGSHKIVYSASDRARNKARPCRFTVSVRRLTCHTVYPTPGLIVSCEEGFGYGASCQFSCQNNYHLQGKTEAKCTRSGSSFLVRWSWGHRQPFCEGKTCPVLAPPANGDLTCDNWLYGRYCKMFCNPDYTAPSTKFGPPTSMFVCGSSGLWSQRVDFQVPGCSRTILPSQFFTGFKMQLLSGDCCDENSTAEIGENLNKFLNKEVSNTCKLTGAECHVGNVRTTCSPDKCNPFNRRKRDAESFDLDVEGIIYYAPSGVQDTTPDATYNEAREAMKELGSSLGDANLTQSVNGSLELKSVTIQKTGQECEEGLQPTPFGAGCVGCESGSFFNQDLDQCDFCPVGTYNNGTQTTECLQCPPFTTTSTTGSKSAEDCIDYCPPGKYSTFGTVPCTPCAVGSYSDERQATVCKLCPLGTTTSSEESSSMEDCQTYSISIVPSANGSYGVVENTFFNVTQLSISMKVFVSSSTILKPVFIIEDDNRLIFSLDLSQEVLLSVSGTEVNISETHLLVENWNTFLISLILNTPPLLTMYVNGMKYEEPIHTDLEQFPSSTRIIIGSQYGTNESYEITELNIWSNATEEEMVLNATNTCSNPYYGDVLSWNDIPEVIELYEAFIEVPSPCDVMDDCITQPCGNSTCVDGVDTFTCICNDGYTGDLCDINIDDCELHACENDATCVDGVDGYICVCTSEFRGQYCELEKVNGGWGEWSEWSPCSKSCNNGTQSRARSCDEPLPGPDGANCSGDSTEQQACNVEECPACAKLENPENGYVLCNYSHESDLNNCTQHCDDGYAFAYEPVDHYVCGYETGYEWNNVTQLQCTEIQAPAEASVGHSITYNMTCTEEAVQAVNNTVTGNLEGISCLQSGLCSLTRIDILGDGCPVHVPGMNQIKVDLVWSIVTSDDTLEASVTGIDVINKLSSPANELIEGITALYYKIENGSFTVTSDDKEYGVLSQSVEPLITCQSMGYVWVDYYCVPCQIGTYGADYTCYECPVGSYQTVIGQDYCTKCPVGLSTETVGSTSPGQCDVPPSEDDVCWAFNTENTELEVGWLSGETQINVNRQYLAAEHFTDVFPTVTVYTDQYNVLKECFPSDTECVTEIDENNLNAVNTYIIKGAVPASDVICTKSFTITYKGISSKGAVLVAFMVLIAIALIIGGAVVCCVKKRSSDKVTFNEDHSHFQGTVQRMELYKVSQQ